MPMWPFGPDPSHTTRSPGAGEVTVTAPPHPAYASTSGPCSCGGTPGIPHFSPPGRVIPLPRPSTVDTKLEQSQLPGGQPGPPYTYPLPWYWSAKLVIVTGPAPPRSPHPTAGPPSRPRTATPG